MRNSISTLIGCAALALFAVGCAGPEQKLGRGIVNSCELFRGGEMRRNIEQTTIFESPEAGYTS